MSINLCVLMGNLVRDPILSYISQGIPVCQFSIAINTKWKDAQGNKQERACFVDVTVWRRQAETISTYLKKGSGCIVQGRLQQDSWTDKTTGQPRHKLFIVASSVTFLGQKPASVTGQAKPTDEAAPPEAVEPPTEEDEEILPF